jgi:hypothetical protein
MKGNNIFIKAVVVSFLILTSYCVVGIENVNEINNIENSISDPYEGRLRIYVVEIESQWDMYNDDPYHYGLIDFAYDDTLSLNYLETLETTIEWEGSVFEDNVMFIAVLFNPKAYLNYADNLDPDDLKQPFDAYYVDACAAATIDTSGSNTVNEDFTHTVFVEKGTGAFCPSCPAMAEKLLAIYESGDYPFYFVSMVVDKSSAANSRMNQLSLYWVPTAYYDGGKEVLIGGDKTEAQHRELIESCGERDVHELDLTITSEYVGGGRFNLALSITNNEEITNTPPDKPSINGLSSGKAGEKYDYTFQAFDIDGDDLYYYIDWGDDQVEEWIGPHSSGEEIILSHTWSEENTYTIRAKVKDINEEESEWETLEISMPKFRVYSPLSYWLSRLINKYPILQKIF